MRISDWSSDVCSSDLATDHEAQGIVGEQFRNTCTVVDVVTYRLIDEAVLYGRNVDRDGDDDADRNHCSQHGVDESHGQVSKSEESRVGTEWVSKCSTGRGQDICKKKIKRTERS